MRSRNEITDDWNAGTSTSEPRIFLEVLLDIRDLLNTLIKSQ